MSLWKHQKCYVPLNLQGTQTLLKQHSRSSKGGLCCNNRKVDLKLFLDYVQIFL